MQRSYSLIIRIYTGLIRLAALFNPKAGKWVQGRKGLRKQISSIRRPKGKLVWFHCASLGEFEQGRPVIEQLKQQWPDSSILLTFFSPSGYEVRKHYDHADYVFYLPADTRSNARFFVRHFLPDAAVFVKYEFWKNYIEMLHLEGIPLFSIAAVFRKNQIFFKPWGKAYRNLLHRFTHIFTQNQESVALLKKHGILHCSVSGDTRFDRVQEIAARVKAIPEIETFKGNFPLLVAGSTWPEDEQLLVEVAAQYREKLKLVVAPHEIGEKHLRNLEKQLENLATLRFSQAKKHGLNGPDVLIIDNIGMLSSIYAYADFAYVGGGFKTGLHNILEPATFGIPVIFGPFYEKFTEAVNLVSKGGAFSISSGEALQEHVASFLHESALRKRTGAICSHYVQSRTGATEIIIKALMPYLEANPRST